MLYRLKAGLKFFGVLFLMLLASLIPWALILYLGFHGHYFLIALEVAVLAIALGAFTAPEEVK